MAVVPTIHMQKTDVGKWMRFVVAVCGMRQQLVLVTMAALASTLKVHENKKGPTWKARRV
jgi:hypothetical protein